MNSTLVCFLTLDPTQQHHNLSWLLISKTSNFCCTLHMRWEFLRLPTSKTRQRLLSVFYMSVSFCLRCLTLSYTISELKVVWFSTYCILTLEDFSACLIFFTVTLCFSSCLLPVLSSLLPSFTPLTSPFSVISFRFILSIQSVFPFTLAPSLFFRLQLILSFPYHLLLLPPI